MVRVDDQQLGNSRRGDTLVSVLESAKDDSNPWWWANNEANLGSLKLAKLELETQLKADPWMIRCVTSNFNDLLRDAKADKPLFAAKCKNLAAKMEEPLDAMSKLYQQLIKTERARNA